jgi:hypothetical protein
VVDSWFVRGAAVVPVLAAGFGARVAYESAGTDLSITPAVAQEVGDLYDCADLLPTSVAVPTTCSRPE